MENKTIVKEETTIRREPKYVLSNDGVKMTYEEWLDMVRSERD